MEKNLILIFTRNPELGKVKTRLAASIGDKNALEIYIHLLEHTKNCIKDIKVDKWIFYSENVNDNDIWDNSIFEKKLQKGEDLGQRMQNAFEVGFKFGFEKIIIVGTDLLTLESKDIEDAFILLEKNDVVIGPAVDGGYYLLGLKKIPKGIFEDKNWGTETVFDDTLKNLTDDIVALITTKNDIDTIDDIKNIAVFKKFL